MSNDPLILKHADDHYWLSITDSDVKLWAKDLTQGYGFDVAIEEPDVSRLAVQGPKSDDLMSKVFLVRSFARLAAFALQGSIFTGIPWWSLVPAIDLGPIHDQR